MKNEGTPRPTSHEQSKDKVDPHRAVREIERSHFFGGNLREMSEVLSQRQAPLSLNEGAEIAFTITHEYVHDESGKLIDIVTTYERPITPHNSDVEIQE